MSECRRRILIVSAKWPLPSGSTDGGDVVLRELIAALSPCADVDLLVFRDDVDEEVAIDGVRHVIVVRQDFARFETYSQGEGAKFLCRIQQGLAAAAEIQKRCDGYDRIVLQHMLFAMGLQDAPDVLARCVLFPMFMGLSYVKAGESVPSSYLDLERKVLPLVGEVITPSECERDMLVQDYAVSCKVVDVIPRIVDVGFVLRKACRKECIEIAYVASIRRQKDHQSAMRLVRRLVERGVCARLHCIGAIQDESLFIGCREYAEANGILENVVFEGNHSREDALSILADCDFNVSTSRWETFGRGILEGLACGVPTLVLQCLGRVFAGLTEDMRPLLVHSVEEMAETIVRLVDDPAGYERESAKGRALSGRFPADDLGRMIREKVLCAGCQARGAVVLVPEDALCGKDDGFDMLARRLFVRREFQALNDCFESSLNSGADDTTRINRALSLHLVGSHDKAKRLYESLVESEIGRINYLAFCHRDFCRANLDEKTLLSGYSGELSPLFDHNAMNSRAASGGLNLSSGFRSFVPLLSEHIENDIRLKRGQPPRTSESLRLQGLFRQMSTIRCQKCFSHSRRRVGFFVTDVQRHSDAAMLYEMTELLAPHCDVYVYFNNAFENKLIRQIAEMCVVRNVISRSLEGVGNQMYDDEIELLIDMSGHGLRNNDIALSWLDGRLHLEGLLAKYPMMLRTTRYFADVRSRANRGGRDIFIPGDVRCMSDPELQGLKALVDGGASRLAFVGHVFEDPMFPEAFKTRLLGLGFKEGDFVLRPCLLPFALYMDYLVGCLGAVIPTGASVADLSEVLCAGVPAVVTSERPCLRKMAVTHRMPVASGGTLPRIDEWRGEISETQNHEVCRCFVRDLMAMPSMLMSKVEDRNTRLAFRVGGRHYCFHETCNGDAVVYAEEEAL